jgi:hypothetical protein
MSMVKERTKIRVIGQVHLGVDEIGADEGRKGHPSSGLGPGQKIMKPGTHDRARDIALRRRKIDPKHTTVLDTIGDILKKMLASTVRGKTGKTIIEGLDHLRTKSNSLKVTKKVDFVKMGQMDGNGMVANPTILGPNGKPRSNRAGRQVDGNGRSLGNAILIPFLIGGGGSRSKR